MTDIHYAILTVKNSKNIKKTHDNIKQSLGVTCNVYDFEGISKEKMNNYCDLAHDLSRNHFSIIKNAYNKNFNYVLIFEDDVDFYKDRDSKHIFNNLLDDMRKIDFDVLHLGSEPNIWSSLFQNRNNIYYMPFGTCAHGYILSKKGMSKILKLEDLIPKNGISDQGCNIHGSDNQYDVLFLPQLTNYTCYPPICYQYKCPYAIRRSMKWSTFPINMNRQIGDCDHDIILDQKNFMAVYIKYFYVFILILFVLLFNKLNGFIKLKKYLKTIFY